MSGKRVHFVSLGCPKNRVDTETMLAGLSDEGCSMTPSADDADIVVVNTCAFVEDAKVESIETILEMAQRKDDGQIEKLVVTGCLAQRYPEELASEMPEVDHFVGTNDLTLVTEILDGRTGGRISVGNPDRRDFNWDAPRYNSMGGHTAYLKVAEGCSNTCAFCIIPTLRGPQRSRGVESVVREATQLAEQGVVEFNLIAQDLTAWGYDLKPRQNLTHLLRALVEVDGIRWIRLMYAYPRSFPKGLVELMATEDKIVPYLDMPLQHISDSVLKGMKRGTRGEAIRKRVSELRDAIPDICMRTTMLVGYPGETDDDFEELLEFVKESKFERLGAFAYSREEGTPSYELDQQLDENTKAARLDRLMFEQRSIARNHNQNMVGREVEVLVEKRSEESELVWIGRTQFQAPEIDGITYLGSSDDVKPGQIVRAIVTQSTDYDLVAEPV
ncbi:MAG: 30S ribosomal protein S12 methylthiotransferase RimO [Myxococcales bacterium]|nr:30S ribosomal protein S12 methylthiotransferase RimO [Myxococcales bacterium]